jgi:hypothetical protein
MLHKTVVRSVPASGSDAIGDAVDQLIDWALNMLRTEGNATRQVSLVDAKPFMVAPGWIAVTVLAEETGSQRPSGSPAVSPPRPTMDPGTR